MQMLAFDPGQPWYHGSPLELQELLAGSTITQRRDLARIFSHKPPLVSIADDGTVKHNGEQPGYLYEIMDEVREGDVLPHPRTTMGPGDEWLTTRPLRVRLLGPTEPRAEELLTEEELAELHARLASSKSDM